jgi:hypothetical protein
VGRINFLNLLGQVLLSAGLDLEPFWSSVVLRPALDGVGDVELSLSKPALSSALLRTCPAAPLNTTPVLSSLDPGASPTIMMRLLDCLHP